MHKQSPTDCWDDFEETNMKTYIVKARRLMGKIPEGFILQVVSSNTSGPQASEIEEALKRAGFTDWDSLSWRSPGNWKIKETNDIF